MNNFSLFNLSTQTINLNDICEPVNALAREQAIANAHIYSLFWFVAGMFAGIVLLSVITYFVEKKKEKEGKK